MNRPIPEHETRPASLPAVNAGFKRRLRQALGCAALGGLMALTATAQVITVDTRTGVVTNGTATKTAPIDVRYQQVKPTHVPLSKSALDSSTRLDLIRLLQSEQGFAMRPLPRGHKGLKLVANGELEPAGKTTLPWSLRKGFRSNPETG